ncbi:MAG: T9SS type A sorting domain-containing protein [Bacteroidota bacterium]
MGPPGGLWSSATNWSATSGGGSGASVPTIATNVVFDNGFNGAVEMDVLPATTPFTYTINSLLITAGSTVTLQKTQAAGGIRVFQLASTSTATPGLKIDNGSTLTIDAVNASGTLNYELAFTGGAGVTGEISGNLYFKGSGLGTGGAEIDLQDDATHFAALTVKNAGIIKYFENTGTTSPSTGSYLTMESGSTYEIEKNGGSVPPGTWSASSLVKIFNPTGMNPPLFLGTAYGNMEWDCPNQVAYSLNADIVFNNVNFINTNSAAFRIKNSATMTNYTMTVNGNLDIGPGSFIEIVGNSSPTATSGKLILKGHLNIQSGGLLTTNGVAGTINRFELQGSANQNINVEGFVGGVRLEFVMNGASSASTATLLTNLSLPGNNNAAGANLQLINGRIITSSSAMLIMGDDAVTSAGSVSSFVAGPMKKTGDDPFTFPIGEGLEFAPIGISGGAGAASFDGFVAQYFRGNPRVVIGPNFQTPAINHMSVLEWWTLERTAGSSSKEVTLYARTYTQATLLSDLRVLRWDGTIWRNEGQVASTGVATGPVRSAAVTGFFGAGTPTRFTFGSVTSFTNPLPINLVSFGATKLSSSQSSIAWELSACCSAAAKFEIQRAGDNRNFMTVGTVNGSSTTIFYTCQDNGLRTGINYYRLKMIDEHGTVTYSKTAVIMNGVDGLLLTSAIPTIITNTTVLTVASSREQKLDIIITDMQGRTVYKQNNLVSTGSTDITVSFARLNPGTYQLTGISAGGKTNTIRVIRQ